MILRLFGALLVALPITTHALTFTFDHANQMVVRPASGSVDVYFSGTLEGDRSEFNAEKVSIPYLSDGVNFLEFHFVVPPPGLGWSERFFLTVNSTSEPGKYGYNAFGDPATYCWGIFTAPSTFNCTSNVSPFSLTVNAAHEPGTLALLGLGVVGLGLSRRRRAD
jgi:hypothetical protein